MITVTPKITDVDIPGDFFRLYIGNHGFPMSISRLKEITAKVRAEEVTQEMVYVMAALKIWAASKSLGIAVPDLTLTQIKTAIETSVEI